MSNNLDKIREIFDVFEHFINIIIQLYELFNYTFQLYDLLKLFQSSNYNRIQIFDCVRER